jgi:hypothetical protein
MLESFEASRPRKDKSPKRRSLANTWLLNPAKPPKEWPRKKKRRVLSGMRMLVHEGLKDIFISVLFENAIVNKHPPSIIKTENQKKLLKSTLFVTVPLRKKGKKYTF